MEGSKTLLLWKWPNVPTLPSPKCASSLGLSTYIPISGKQAVIKMGSFWVEIEKHEGCQSSSFQSWRTPLGLRGWGASDYGMGNSAVSIQGTWTGLGGRQALERHLLLSLGLAQNRGFQQVPEWSLVGWR